MTCKRYVYQRYSMTSYRTIPPVTINKPVRYRDEHEPECKHDCTPLELPWPKGEPWEMKPVQPEDDE